MPTYAPIPSTFTCLSKQQQAIQLYRHILRQGSLFFDERASNWIRTTAQEKFRKHKPVQDEKRVAKYLSDGRKALRTLERGNRIDLKAVQKVLGHAYGLKGLERRKLIQPFVDSARSSTSSPARLSRAIAKSGSTTVTTGLPAVYDTLGRHLAQDPPSPLHFENKHTVPPIYSPPVTSLILASCGGKDIHPTLPQPLVKPLHGKREANLRWRHFSKQIGKLSPPLHSELRLEMELKANIGRDEFWRILRDNGKVKTKTADFDVEMTEHDWRLWEQTILKSIGDWSHRGSKQKVFCQEKGVFHSSIGGKPARGNILTPRLYRRLWQRLLADIPILDVQPTSTTPQFSISRSKFSYMDRFNAALEFRAIVNEFDRIGYVEATGTKPTSRTKKATQIKTG